VENLQNFSYPTFLDLIWDEEGVALDYCITFTANSRRREEICNVHENKFRWNQTSTGREALVYKIFVVARGMVGRGPPSNAILATFYSSGKF